MIVMYTILGATGNVGRKIADNLIKKCEKVRLVAHSADKFRTIVGHNAHAFVGDAKDTEFLSKEFRDSDAFFMLLPPNITTEKFLPYAEVMSESIASTTTRKCKVCRQPFKPRGRAC